ncbi:uncharacterized protein LY89DRAFT_736846 [Mollisia scopiformis]|uniref:Uncharacterized protein n=1 Tax=Mollisia scopiformis TaxID=149040 RepID=A0A194X0X9_MOLSC|nr:uncharacterized protein LY89DRAFT_736846 [Mollisia scopiformis]KUJ13851.1 hypothetical protein LY89DRAFT_736846 [Mollisia scopiformis]
MRVFQKVYDQVPEDASLSKVICNDLIHLLGRSGYIVPELWKLAVGGTIPWKLLFNAFKGAVTLIPTDVVEAIFCPKTADFEFSNSLWEYWTQEWTLDMFIKAEEDVWDEKKAICPSETSPQGLD